MAAKLEPGLAAETTFAVEIDRTIDFLGPELRVYATPLLIRDVEAACIDCLMPFLRAGQHSVGTHIAIDHVAAVLLGGQVTIRVTVTAVDRRRVGFAFEVVDASGVIAHGRHDRFIVDLERFKEQVRGRRA